MKGRYCTFCKAETKYIDYKNVVSYRRFISIFGKIVPRYYNGNCLKHQKMVARAIKNGRHAGLVPFVRVNAGNAK